MHLAVGWNAGQLKVGSFARSERMAKWNEGLRIEEAAAATARLPPRAAFPWGANEHAGAVAFDASARRSRRVAKRCIDEL